QSRDYGRGRRRLGHSGRSPPGPVAGGRGRCRRRGFPAGRDVSRRPGDRQARRGVYRADRGCDAGSSDVLPVSAGDLGAAALRAALFLSLWGTGAAIYAAWRRDVRALVSARIAAGVAFGLVVIAALSMMFALATHDFSILYVAENN